MDVATQIYIETVQVSDIPWHRLTTTYGRATDFPTELDVLCINRRCGMLHHLP